MEKGNKELSVYNLSKEKVDLIKKTVCKDATDEELQLFIHICQKCELDPFMKQIYAVKRKGVMTIQTSIDGLRLIADRSGNYAPGREAVFSYDERKSLVSATAFLKKRTKDGTWHEVSVTAFYSEYKPSFENNFWKQMPHIMLAKCAEAAALRKAFPAEMSGLYTEDEMEQAMEEKLSTEQCEEVLELVGEDNELLQRILKGYRVKELNEIKSSNFTPIVNNLQRRRQIQVSA